MQKDHSSPTCLVLLCSLAGKGWGCCVCGNASPESCTYCASNVNKAEEGAVLQLDSMEQHHVSKWPEDHP